MYLCYFYYFLHLCAGAARCVLRLGRSLTVGSKILGHELLLLPVVDTRQRKAEVRFVWNTEEGYFSVKSEQGNFEQGNFEI